MSQQQACNQLILYSIPRDSSARAQMMASLVFMHELHSDCGNSVCVCPWTWLIHGSCASVCHDTWNPYALNIIFDWNLQKRSINFNFSTYVTLLFEKSIFVKCLMTKIYFFIPFPLPSWLAFKKSRNSHK